MPLMQVLDGMDIMRIAELEGDGDGNTSRPVVIDDCGELDESGAQIEYIDRHDEDKLEVSQMGN